MFSERHRCFFIHIPKTGGSSIGATFKSRGFKHTPARQYIEKYGRDLWDAYFTFTIVRNPWDRLVSYYHWRRHRYEESPEKCPDVEKPFREWMKYIDALIEAGDNETMNRIWAPPYHKFDESIPRPNLAEAWKIKLGSQSFMIADESGKILVDHVGRFENLHNEFDYLRSKVGGLKDLPHRKDLSDRSHYREFYDDETAALVEKLYAEDIERFGYSF